MITREAISHAAARIAGHVRRTPVVDHSDKVGKGREFFPYFFVSGMAAAAGPFCYRKLRYG